MGEEGLLGTIASSQITGAHIDDIAIGMKAPNLVNAELEGLEKTVITMDYHWRKNHWPHGK